MTRYARIENGEVAEYPYSLVKLHRDNPDVSFPAELSDELLADYGVLPVIASVPPTVPIDKNLIEGSPSFNGGVVTQVWSMTDASAEEIAQRQEQAAQATEFDAAKLDAWIVQFLAMTPSGAQDFVNANGATLAAVRTNVARLAYVVRVLVRREFNR